MPLEKEISFFEKNRCGYVDQHEGKFALIKGEACHGFFDSDRAAYERGVEMFGAEPFLIKVVLPTDPIDQAPALTYGLIRASV